MRDDAPQQSAWKSVEIARGSAKTRVLILCDHATNLLPAEYGRLGLDESQLNRHIGYDIGALGVSLELGRRLDATVVYSQFSRLLIDPNRGVDDPTLIMRISDGAVIAGNARLTDTEVAARIARFYNPYHAAIETELATIEAHGGVPIVLAVHSYTDVWRGVLRKWHAGVLWDKDPRLAMPLISALHRETGLEIGDNEPYSGRLRGNGIYRHGTLRGFPNALVEIRQDLIREQDGQREWADILLRCLTSILADTTSAADLSRVEFYGSHTDIRGGERHSL